MADDGLRPFPPYAYLENSCRAEKRSVIRRGEHSSPKKNQHLQTKFT